MLIKKLKADNKKFQETIDIKSIEIKQLKSEMETIKKEKKAFSVALKGSKKLKSLKIPLLRKGKYSRGKLLI